MLHALLVLAAEEAEPSKTAFYILGGLLAVFAVVLSAVGLRRADFPGGESGTRGVVGLTVLLVLATMATVIATS